MLRMKALSRGAGSELTEQLVHEVLTHGNSRKHRSMLLDRLQRARGTAVRRLEAIGFGPIADDTFGLFAWMDVPGMADAMLLAEAAAQRGMLLAPGSMFSPESAPSTKMRFNVAFCQHDEVFVQLEALLREFVGRGKKAGAMN